MGEEAKYGEMVTPLNQSPLYYIINDEPFVVFVNTGRTGRQKLTGILVFKCVTNNFFVVCFLRSWAGSANDFF